jgi:type II secretory pathway component HofQ
MPSKQELEALKEEAREQGLSEQAFWIQKKLQNDYVPALTVLESNKVNNLDFQKEKADTLITKNDLIQAVSTLESIKANKSSMIESDDATDLDSAITLLNEIKTKLNLMNL